MSIEHSASPGGMRGQGTMITKTISAAGLLAGLLCLTLPTPGAMAAPAAREPTKIAEAAQAQPAAVTDEEDTATCSKSRKRLWVEGEGWIVRRVTTCR